MSLTPDELRQLAVTFPRAHAAQINAKTAKYGISREDVRQELSLICIEKGPEFDPAKGTLPQFLFGHLDKRLRRQLGAHTFAISLDRADALDESTRTLVDNLSVPANDDNEPQCPLIPDQPGVAKILSVAVRERQVERGPCSSSRSDPTPCTTDSSGTTPRTTDLESI